MIGPKGQAVLLPYLLRDAESFCFVHSRTGERYTSALYRDAVHRGCELAFRMPYDLVKAPRCKSPEQRKQLLELARQWRAEHCWNPNQIRHTLGTAVRKTHGLEASQVVLGHTRIETTEIYAERDLEKASQIMGQVG